MLILAFLMRTSLDWRGAELTVNMVVPKQDALSGATDNLEKMVTASRTGALTQVLVSNN